MAEQAIAIQKKYNEACSYQERKNFEAAKKLFKELRRANYKDSSERLQQVQNEIDKILLDPDKPNKLQKLREEYKKYATITLVLALMFPFVAIALFAFAVFSGVCFLLPEIFSILLVMIAFVLWFLAIGYLMMHNAFKKKVKSDKALDDVYLNVMATDNTPASSFKILTWCIAIIAGIISIIIMIASYA